MAIGEMNAFCEATFPAWTAVDWANWKPQPPIASETSTNGDGQAASDSLAALQFGRFNFALETPAAPQAEPGQAIPKTNFLLPAVLAYPDCPSLLLESGRGGTRRGDARYCKTSCCGC